MPLIWKVDEATFKCPVRVTHVRIVPLYVSDTRVPTFAGFTSPGSFELRIFGGRADQTDCRFTELCPALQYEAPLSDSFCTHTEPAVVDHLVIRGRYRTLSMIIVGVAAEDAVVENCSFLWGRELPESNEVPLGVTLANGGEAGAKDACDNLGELLPLGYAGECDETHLGDEIQETICDLDTVASGGEDQFDKFRTEVLSAVSCKFRNQKEAMGAAASTGPQAQPPAAAPLPAAPVQQQQQELAVPKKAPPPLPDQQQQQQHLQQWQNIDAAI